MGWEKYYDPDGRSAKPVDWWPAPEAPSRATSQNGTVKYRYRMKWKTGAITSFTEPNAAAVKLLGHNGAHQVSLADVDGVSGNEVVFASYLGAGSEIGRTTGAAASKAATVKNLTITNVSTNAKNPDYFFFGYRTQVINGKEQLVNDEKYLFPDLEFEIEDLDLSHAYLWTIEINDTNTAEWKKVATIKGVATSKGKVTVSVNDLDGQKALRPFSQFQSGWLSKSGTYSFDIFVKELPRKPALNEPKSWARLAYLDYWALKQGDANLGHGYKLRFPKEDRNKHFLYMYNWDSEEEFVKASGVPTEKKAAIGYIVADTDNPTTFNLSEPHFKAKKVWVDLVNPEFEVLHHQDDMETEVQQSHVYPKFASFPDNKPSFVMIAVFMGLDEHAAEYRDHQPHHAIAVNDRNAQVVLERVPDSSNATNTTPRACAGGVKSVAHIVELTFTAYRREGVDVPPVKKGARQPAPKYKYTPAPGTELEFTVESPIGEAKFVSHKATATVPQAALLLDEDNLPAKSVNLNEIGGVPDKYFVPKVKRTTDSKSQIRLRVLSSQYLTAGLSEEVQPKLKVTTVPKPAEPGKPQESAINVPLLNPGKVETAKPFTFSFEPAQSKRRTALPQFVIAGNNNSEDTWARDNGITSSPIILSEPGQRAKIQLFLKFDSSGKSLKAGYNERYPANGQPKANDATIWKPVGGHTVKIDLSEIYWKWRYLKQQTENGITTYTSQPRYSLLAPKDFHQILFFTDENGKVIDSSGQPIYINGQNQIVAANAKDEAGQPIEKHTINSPEEIADSARSSLPQTLQVSTDENGIAIYWVKSGLLISKGIYMAFQPQDQTQLRLNVTYQNPPVP